MVLCPILIRVAERFGHEGVACLLSYIGYFWMGGVFIFFVVSLTLDVYRLLLLLGGMISSHSFSSLVPSPQILFWLPLIVSVGINIYGYFEARYPRLETVEIRTAKLPPEIGHLRIVQISDVHVGMIVQGDRLARMVDMVKEARPDILVSTGDLVDGQIDSIGRYADLFRNVPARYGKYAITGNHEFYAGLEQALKFTRDSGFRVLRGETVDVGGLIRLVGVDDPTARYMGMPSAMSEKELLAAGTGTPLFTILLKHQPVVRKESAGAFDLQLSGHTHKGQIFPFNLITKIYFPMQNGYHNLSDGSALYVSRGTGTWGPPIRFLSPPEVTLIDLVNNGK
jgi:predicted MPP superfamily phosphohydrolase